MTEEQLQQLRRERWRLNGNPVRTLEEAREFLAANGFCLMYPIHPSTQNPRVPGPPATQPHLLAPTFIGACVGSGDNLPNWQQATGDERAQQAQELMVRLLREKSAYEANVFGQTSFLLSAAVFPFFYALAGSRNPKQPPQAKPGAASPLAVDAFVALQKHGPLNKEKLAHLLGGSLSEPALDRALNELWLELRITRVDYVAGEGAYWDVLYRWSPEAVREGARISIPEAVSALISQYLQCAVAAEAGEIENFLNVLVPRTRVKEVIKALLAGRELEHIVVGSKTLLKLAGEPVPESQEEPPVRMERPAFPGRALPGRAAPGRVFPGRAFPDRTSEAGIAPRAGFARSGPPSRNSATGERRRPKPGETKEQGRRPRRDKPGSIRGGSTGRRSGPSKFRGAAKGHEAGGREMGRKSYHGEGPKGSRSDKRGSDGRRSQGSARYARPLPPADTNRDKKDEDKTEG